MTTQSLNDLHVEYIYSVISWLVARVQDSTPDLNSDLEINERKMDLKYIFKGFWVTPLQCAHVSGCGVKNKRVWGWGCSTQTEGRNWEHTTSIQMSSGVKISKSLEKLKKNDLGHVCIFHL